VVRPQDGGKKAASAAVAAAIDLAERAAQVSTAPSVSIPAGTAEPSALSGAFVVSELWSR
jgi:hypothetical protein